MLQLIGKRLFTISHSKFFVYLSLWIILICLMKVYNIFFLPKILVVAWRSGSFVGLVVSSFADSSSIFVILSRRCSSLFCDGALGLEDKSSDWFSVPGVVILFSHLAAIKSSILISFSTKFLLKSSFSKFVLVMYWMAALNVTKQ